MTSNSPQIVITGVASGIGKETAQLLSSQGYHVIGVDRAPVEDFAGTFIQGDLSDPTGVNQIADKIRETDPAGIHGLANIAGVPGTAPTEVVLNINVFGVRDLIQAVRPQLQRGSSIVNLASAVAYQWRAHKAQLAEFALAADRQQAMTQALADDHIVGHSYLFSKQCVSLLSEYFAAEFVADGIRVNSVSPGPVETPILEDFKNDHGRDKVNSAATTLGRFGAPADIAQCIAYLLSPEAGWVNGTDLRVDGGLTAYRETAQFRDGSQQPVQA